MAAVGVRELKERTSQVLRQVRDGRETIDVTYHGRVIARLTPVEEPQPENSHDLAKFWSDLERLTAEISARCPAEVNASDVIADIRRDL